MMRSLGIAFRATRELGWHPMAIYALYAFQRRVGWLRYKTPIRDWNANRLSRRVKRGIPSNPELYCEYRLGLNRSFFFHPRDDLTARLQEVLGDNEMTLLREADEIVEGRFSLFGQPPRKLGFPPEWSTFPAPKDEPEGIRGDLGGHWTEIDIESLPGDIKLLWEPARFGWVYLLGRAFRLSGDRKYAEAFCILLESWRVANPPNQGPHWISAQEAAIRLMALVFAVYAFHPLWAEEPRYLVTLTETIAAHAERIPPTLLYSRSQGNNHLILEAVGLYTVGVLFPELKKAAQWHRTGRRWFLSALSDQVFSDGGYVQHSTNYHRLALHAALWVIRLGELNGEAFPQETMDAVRMLASCLGGLLDPVTGQVPNFGPNDGALILPLTTCSFHNYRPVIQLSHQLLFDKRVFESGAWDEAGFWFGLGGSAPAGGEGKRGESLPLLDIARRTASGEALPRRERSLPEAGLHLLGGDESWGLLRCAKFTGRPGHSDQLHLDLWWNGENIARDPGTYLYNGDTPWENGLATLKVHNSIVVDELEPMQRAGRFLWLNWAQGELLIRKRSVSGNLEFISASHHGYKHFGIETVRSVVRAEDQLWLVVDEVIGKGVHKLRSGWLLPEAAWAFDRNSIALEGPMGDFKVEFLIPEARCGLYRAGELIAGEDMVHCGEILGWFSPTYAAKETGLYFAASIEGELPLRLVTRWCLGDVDPGKLSVELDESGECPAGITRISYGQEVLDL